MNWTNIEIQAIGRLVGPNIDSVHRIEHLANIDHVRECRKGLIMGDVIKLLFNYLFL